MSVDSPDKRLVKCLNQGLFEKTLKINGEDGLINGICYKELGLYDEALEIFLIDPNGFKRVQIACCYKGVVEKGIKVLDSIIDYELGQPQLIDIGRALYKVGW